MPRLALALALLVGALLTACGDSDGLADGTDTERLSLAFVSNGAADFWTIAGVGAHRAGMDLGVDVSVHFPTEGPTGQKRVLEDLLTRGVDGISVSPIDPVNQNDILSQVASRAALVTNDSDAPDSPRLAYVGMDNYDAGRMCGQLVTEAFPDGAEVFIFIGRLEQHNAKRRRQGVIDEILGRSHDPERYDPPGARLEGNGFTILGTLTDNFDRAKAKANVEDALSRNPDLDVCVGLFEYNATMIVEVLTQSGKLGEVAIAGFDEAEQVLDAVAAGHALGTVVQDPYAYGYESMRILAAHLRGEDDALPEGGVLAIPARTLRADDIAGFKAVLLERLGAGG